MEQDGFNKKVHHTNTAHTSMMATPHYSEDSDTDTVDLGYFATTEEEEGRRR